jgi:acyl-CoA synthetase (AMP-forming)/AMP-acid ligase II
VTTVIAAGDLRAPANIDPVALVRQIRAVRPVRTAASPALLDRLAGHLAATGERLDLARIFTGGAPVFPGLLDRLAAVAPAAVITAVYGSTEAEPIATLHAADISVDDRAAMQRGSGLLAGRPVASIAMRIIPDQWGIPLGPLDEPAFQRLTLPVGEAGEVVVAGPHVMTGYLDRCGHEQAKIRVGDRVWHRTGDAGYVDSSGRLWLLGRCAARIHDARGTVYPFAVECALSGIAGVRRTAFVAHRGRRLLVAELQTPRSSACVEALKQQSAWACPDDVVVVDRIPVDARHNAKVDYVALRRLLDRITAFRRPTAPAPGSGRCDRRWRVPAHR